MGLSAVSPSCWKSWDQWCLRRKSPSFDHVLSVDIPLVLFFSSPLSSVWVTALHGRPGLHITLTLPLSSGLVSTCGSYNFCLLCLPGFSLPPRRDALSSACGIASRPAHRLCLPLPDLRVLPRPTALHPLFDQPCDKSRPSPPSCLPALSCHRQTSSHQQ